jgi:hypothetical protein
LAKSNCVYARLTSVYARFTWQMFRGFGSLGHVSPPVGVSWWAYATNASCRPNEMIQDTTNLIPGASGVVEPGATTRPVASMVSFPVIFCFVIGHRAAWASTSAKCQKKADIGFTPRQTVKQIEGPVILARSIYSPSPRLMHRNPRWQVEVSVGSAWRAAPRCWRSTWRRPPSLKPTTW